MRCGLTADHNDAMSGSGCSDGCWAEAAQTRPSATAIVSANLMDHPPVFSYQTYPCGLGYAHILMSGNHAPYFPCGSWIKVFSLAPMCGNMLFLCRMRILGVAALSAHAKQKPRSRRHVLAFCGLVSVAAWRRLKDVEEQFGRVVSFDPPDRVTFNFAEEDLRIEMRVNFTLGLVLVVKAPFA